MDNSSSVSGSDSNTVIFTPISTSDTEPSRGAFYQPTHLVRAVKIYPIQESELRTLSMFSTIVTVVASIASLAFAFALSVWWDVMQSKDIAATKLGYGVLVVCGVVILGCVGVGAWAIMERKSQLQTIISESRVLGTKAS
jgi:hypothetical protein